MVNWTAADERFATHALTVGRVDREAWKTEFSSLANEPLPPRQGPIAACLNRLRLLSNLRVRALGTQSQRQPL
ncbi:MAG: hypothetical protein QOF01_4818 [Thermomicrobiales bacterium]|jgi:hypothetical protein|nr:hypothetical protein [Thermomicrobiales bacterium]MEA2598349.1 hypothetical protein [Thermomicrobiales bacterium]